MNESFGIGHNGGPALEAPLPPPWLAGRTARLRRRGRPVATSGRARADEWLLRFERATPPVIEPLMGWTGGDDTLATQVELAFDTREAALAYAERQGIDVRVEGEAVRGPVAKARLADEPPSPARDQALGAVVWLTSLQAAYGRCNLSGPPDLERALVNPAAVFAAPDDVLRHPLLSLDCKREILWRWAWDEYLKDLAAEEGMAAGEPSRLDEVKAALLALGQSWTPSPAAPAARLAVYQPDPRLTMLAA